MEQYSVLMSVYCNENPNYLKEAILSMINQTVKPSDFVIVCDGPLTVELDAVICQMVENYKELFQIIRLPENRGLGIALREGLEKCHYELVARMDSDDIANLERIENQLEVFMKDSKVSVVGGQIEEFCGSIDNATGYRCVPLEFDEIKKRAVKRNPMNHMTVMFKKSHVQDAGSYMGFEKFEDYYLWIRMLSKGYKFVNIDKMCVHARVDENSYKRRSGLSYFKQTMKLQMELKRLGFVDNTRLLLNIIVRFIGTVILPNGLRRISYNWLLRKKTNTYEYKNS